MAACGGRGYIPPRMTITTAPSFENPEIVQANSTNVVCDGNGLGGHPRVFLTMGKSNSVDCPYCDRRFVLKPGAKAASGH